MRREICGNCGSPINDDGACDCMTKMTDCKKVIHPKLETYIATRDKRISKYWPHDRTHIHDLFTQLLERGAVTVGYRSTCGGSDPTMHVYRAWNEVVRKARALGYQITAERVRGIKNSWASLNGGFWDEIEYKLVDNNVKENNND